jgi:hypothetical protein
MDKESVKSYKRQYELAKTVTERQTAKVRVQTIRAAAANATGVASSTKLRDAADNALRVMS